MQRRATLDGHMSESSQSPPLGAELAHIASTRDQRSRLQMGARQAPERHMELALTMHTNRQVRRRVLGHLEDPDALLVPRLLSFAAPLVSCFELASPFRTFHRPNLSRRTCLMSSISRQTSQCDRRRESLFDRRVLVQVYLCVCVCLYWDVRRYRARSLFCAPQLRCG